MFLAAVIQLNCTSNEQANWESARSLIERAAVGLLAQNTLRYRRQVLRFKQAFSAGECTALLLDDQSGAGDIQVRPRAVVDELLQLRSRLLETRARLDQARRRRGGRQVVDRHHVNQQAGPAPRERESDDGSRDQQSLSGSAGRGSAAGGASCAVG